jgi:hypothetical protein
MRLEIPVSDAPSQDDDDKRGLSIGEGIDNPLLRGLVLAIHGSGPLLQRDYWAVIDQSRLSPTELGSVLARDFCAFAPEELVRFDREATGDLQVGEEIDVRIRMAGDCRVRVLHRDQNSLTLGTLEGHPEAGRITFGAYRNNQGDVVFHIRSRARASSAPVYAGYVTAGEPMQTNTWTDFIDRVAHSVGTGIKGAIRVETTDIDDDVDGPGSECTPTFRAVGD